MRSFILLFACFWHSPDFAEGSFRRLPKDGKIPGIPHDIYHCNHVQDEKWQDDDTVECNEDTNYQWDTDEFDPNEPPDRCEDFDYEKYDPKDDDEWNSYWEPCLLWEMVYGELKDSAAPSPLQPSSAPSTSQPTKAPSSTPTSSLVPTRAPIAAPTATPSPTHATTSPTHATSSPSHAPFLDLMSLEQLKWTPFVLSLVVPAIPNRRKLQRNEYNVRLRGLQDTPTIQVDRDEWLALTEDHVWRQMVLQQPERLVKMDMAFDQPTEYVYVEGDQSRVELRQEVQGTVYSKDLESSMALWQLDAMLKASFEDTALFEYLVVLEAKAQDPFLSQAQKVIFSSTVQNEDTGPSNSKDGWLSNTSNIILVASIGAVLVGMVVMGVVGYKVVKSRRQDAAMFINDDDVMKLPKTDTADTQDSPQSSDSRCRKPLPQDAPRPMEVANNSQFHEDDDDDAESVATSTYSYIDDESSIMSVSMNRQYSYLLEDENSLSLIRLETAEIKNVSLGTIQSNDDEVGAVLPDMHSLAKVSDDDTTNLSAMLDHEASTTGVLELFGPDAVSMGSRERSPPLFESRGDDNNNTSSSYDGHLALSRYYEDKNDLNASVVLEDKGGGENVDTGVVSGPALVHESLVVDDERDVSFSAEEQTTESAANREGHESFVGEEANTNGDAVAHEQ